MMQTGIVSIVAYVIKYVKSLKTEAEQFTIWVHLAKTLNVGELGWVTEAT